MKKALHILPILIAVLSMIVLSITPHHHHQQVVCMVLDLCEEDDIYNDHHTSHDTSEEESSHCNAQYIVAYNAPNGSSLLDGDDNQYVIKYFRLLTSYLRCNFEYSTTQIEYNENIIVSYESALLGLCSGLRAPP